MTLPGITPTTEPVDVRVPVAPGVRLAVRRWAGGDEVPFVLVHGLASNAQMWDGVAERLAAAGHPVDAVDLRGHGRSDTPADGYDQATAAADLVAVAVAAGAGRPVVVGQSWGGNVVVELAARHPAQVRGIAAVDGGAIDLRAAFPDWDACARALAPPDLTALSPAQLEARVRAAHPGWPEAGIRGVLASFGEGPGGRVRPHLARAHHMAILADLWAHPPTARFAAVTVPVLLVPADGAAAGRAEDRRRAVDAAAAALARARVAWLRGHHDLHAEQPDRVAALLLDAVADGFLTGVAA